MLGVDLLEVVDVDQDEGERTLMALGTPRLRPQLLVESAVVRQVRQLIAGGERAELGTGVGKADGRLGGEGERRESVAVAANRDECSPEPSADADRRGASAARPVRKTIAAGSSRLERHGRAGDESHRATRLAGADDRPEATRLEADDCSRVDVQFERDLFRDDRKELNRVGLERDRILDALLRRSCSQVRCVVQNRDDACDEAELVAAREAPAFEDDVAAVLAGVALRSVCGRNRSSGCRSE